MSVVATQLEYSHRQTCTYNIHTPTHSVTCVWLCSNSMTPCSGRIWNYYGNCRRYSTGFALFVDKCSNAHRQCITVASDCLHSGDSLSFKFQYGKHTETESITLHLFVCVVELVHHPLVQLIIIFHTDSNARKTIQSTSRRPQLSLSQAKKVCKFEIVVTRCWGKMPWQTCVVCHIKISIR